MCNSVAVVARHVLTGEELTTNSINKMAKELGSSLSTTKDCLYNNRIMASGHQLRKNDTDWGDIVIDRKTVLRCGEYRAIHAYNSEIIYGTSVSDIADSINLLALHCHISESSLEKTLHTLSYTKEGWKVECVWGRYIVRSNKFKTIVISKPGVDVFKPKTAPKFRKEPVWEFVFD